MASPLVAIGVTIAAPIAGWLVKHVLLDRLSEWWSKRKIAKIYKDSGEIAQGPPAAVFAPPPPTTQEQLVLEHQRTKVKQVLLGAELEVAEDALHNLRTLLDRARKETLDVRAELVGTRKLHDDLKVKYDALERAAEALKKEYETVLKEGGTNVTSDRKPDTRHFGGVHPGLRGGRGLPAPPDLRHIRKRDEDPAK